MYPACPLLSSAFSIYLYILDVAYIAAKCSNLSRRAPAGMVLETINKCDVDIRRELYSGIILTGGTALLTAVRLCPRSLSLIPATPHPTACESLHLSRKHYSL